METQEGVAQIPKPMNAEILEAPEIRETELPINKYYVKKVYPKEVGLDGKTPINRGPWTKKEKQIYFDFCEEHKEAIKSNRTKEFFKLLFPLIPSRNPIQIRSFHTLHNPYPGPVVIKEKRIRKTKVEMKKFRDLYLKTRRKQLERQKKRLQQLTELILKGDNVTSNQIQLLEFLCKSGEKVFIDVYVNPEIEVKNEIKVEEPKEEESKVKEQKPPNDLNLDLKSITESCQLSVVERKVTDKTKENDNVRYKFQDFIEILKKNENKRLNNHPECILIEDDDKTNEQQKEQKQPKNHIDVYFKNNVNQGQQFEANDQELQQSDKDLKQKALNLQKQQTNTNQPKILSTDDVKEEDDLQKSLKELDLPFGEGKPHPIKVKQLINQLENTKPTKCNIENINLLLPDEAKIEENPHQNKETEFKQFLDLEQKNQHQFQLPTQDIQAQQEAFHFQQLIQLPLLSGSDLIQVNQSKKEPEKSSKKQIPRPEQKPNPNLKTVQDSIGKNTPQQNTDQQNYKIKIKVPPQVTEKQIVQKAPIETEQPKQNQVPQQPGQIKKKIIKEKKKTDKPQENHSEEKQRQQIPKPIEEPKEEQSQVQEKDAPKQNEQNSPSNIQPKQRNLPENSQPYFGIPFQWNPQMPFYQNPMMPVPSYMYPIPPMIPYMNPYVPIPSQNAHPNKPYPFPYPHPNMTEQQQREQGIQNNQGNDVKVEMMYVYHEVPQNFDQNMFFQYSPSSFEQIPRGSILGQALNKQ